MGSTDSLKGIENAAGNAPSPADVKPDYDRIEEGWEGQFDLWRDDMEDDDSYVLESGIIYDDYDEEKMARDARAKYMQDAPSDPKAWAAADRGFREIFDGPLLPVTPKSGGDVPKAKGVTPTIEKAKDSAAGLINSADGEQQEKLQAQMDALLAELGPLDPLQSAEPLQGKLDYQHIRSGDDVEGQPPAGDVYSAWQDYTSFASQIDTLRNDGWLDSLGNNVQENFEEPQYPDIGDALMYSVGGGLWEGFKGGVVKGVQDGIKGSLNKWATTALSNTNFLDKIGPKMTPTGKSIVGANSAGIVSGLFFIGTSIYEIATKGPKEWFMAASGVGKAFEAFQKFKLAGELNDKSTSYTPPRSPNITPDVDGVKTGYKIESIATFLDGLSSLYSSIGGLIGFVGNFSYALAAIFTIIGIIGAFWGVGAALLAMVPQLITFGNWCSTISTVIGAVATVVGLAAMPLHIAAMSLVSSDPIAMMMIADGVKDGVKGMTENYVGGKVSGAIEAAADPINDKIKGDAGRPDGADGDSPEYPGIKDRMKRSLWKGAKSEFLEFTGLKALYPSREKIKGENGEETGKYKWTLKGDLVDGFKKLDDMEKASTDDRMGRKDLQAAMEYESDQASGKLGPRQFVQEGANAGDEIMYNGEMQSSMLANERGRTERAATAKYDESLTKSDEERTTKTAEDDAKTSTRGGHAKAVFLEGTSRTSTAYDDEQKARSDAKGSRESSQTASGVRGVGEQPKMPKATSVPGVDKLYDAVVKNPIDAGAEAIGLKDPAKEKKKDERGLSQQFTDFFGDLGKDWKEKTVDRQLKKSEDKVAEYFKVVKELDDKTDLFHAKKIEMESALGVATDPMEEEQFNSLGTVLDDAQTRRGDAHTHVGDAVHLNDDLIKEWVRLCQREDNENAMLGASKQIDTVNQETSKEQQVKEAKLNEGKAKGAEAGSKGGEASGGINGFIGDLMGQLAGGIVGILTGDDASGSNDDGDGGGESAGALSDTGKDKAEHTNKTGTAGAETDSAAAKVGEQHQKTKGLINENTSSLKSFESMVVSDKTQTMTKKVQTLEGIKKARGEYEANKSAYIQADGDYETAMGEMNMWGGNVSSNVQSASTLIVDEVQLDSDIKKLREQHKTLYKDVFKMDYPNAP